MMFVNRIIPINTAATILAPPNLPIAREAKINTIDPTNGNAIIAISDSTFGFKLKWGDITGWVSHTVVSAEKVSDNNIISNG
jgi:hypothetical protein